MTDTHFIQSAYWEAENRILVQLRRDWEPEDPLPPLFLGPKPRPFAKLERVSLTEYGQLAHYYIEQNKVVFLLDPDHYPQMNLLEEKVYVAGSFNGWQEAMGDENWQMGKREQEGHTFLICESTLEAMGETGVEDADTPHFKFLTGEGVWIGGSMNAPNLTFDEMGNANYALRSWQTGRHLFYATLEKEVERDGHETLLWSDGEHREAVPIPSTLKLLELQSDLPLGAFPGPEETCFRLFAPRASRVEVRFYAKPDSEQRQVRLKRGSSGIWEIVVKEDLTGWFYHYQIYGREQDGTTHFDPSFPILDPYAMSTLGARGPGIILNREHLPRVAEADRFQPPDWHDLVILECHLADLVDLSPYKENPEEPPRYRHLTAMLHDPQSYIRCLGVNAIQLQPLQQSDKQSPEEYHWGYMTTNFFSLECSYAEDPLQASQIGEFQEMVQAAHEAGIAVILDVVYNHVGEPAHVLFIDKFYYFELDHLQDLTNWSGCGNDLRCDAPMVKRLILDSLLFLVRHFDVDGFRFDLAELIGKPVLEEIADVLKQEKPSLILIAEPWSFRAHIAAELKDTPYASWNDSYREFIREYVVEKGNADGLRYFLTGSQDHLASWPAQTVNYTESHDDYCWLDAITENEDHQGFHPQVSDRRRTHLMVSLLMMSLGMPMLAEGQDFLRSKQGMNNTYQRGDLNALNYERLLYYTNTHRYFRQWILFRLGPWGELLRLSAFPGEGYWQCYGKEDTSALMVRYNADGSHGSRQMIYAINPHAEPVSIRCPELDEQSFIQVADSERINPEGLVSALLPIKRATKKIPALSAYLWVSH